PAPSPQPLAPFLAGLVCLLALCFPIIANAASSSTAPISITADHWQANQQTGISVYTGHVIILQDNVRITADEARIKMHDGVLQHVTIIGSPATFVQTPTNQPPLQGEADRVEYNAVEETATLTGNAVLNQGVDTIRAASIFVDVAAEKVTAHSDKQTPERVHIIITPQTDNSAEEQVEK
ncbi:MAG TPA: lipopolysaccharide transport periplasmic protein LptA, partial [Gammaproteobacteria bacterium]|nr:lipopolysaccharide transport periplasmic protein LptA [Gammaproteobacteria bacterium]